MLRFAESPVPWLLAGLAIESVLLILYLQTRRMAFLAAIVIFAILTAAGVALEQAIVTDREAIERAVYELAERIEADDTQGVVALISPEASRVRDVAAREMEHYRVELARITSRLQIEILEVLSPRLARVEFRAVVRASEGRSGFGGTGRLDFVLTLIEENDRWLLYDYTYEIQQ